MNDVENLADRQDIDKFGKLLNILQLLSVEWLHSPHFGDGQT
jgi:hypothetical protein